MLCTLDCGRKVPAWSPEEEICPQCISWLRLKSAQTSADFRNYCRRTDLRVKRQQQITGRRGEGPKDGSYVARLLVKRRARDRADKQRGTRRDGPIRHFPRVSE